MIPGAQMNHFLLIKNLFKSITYGLNACHHFVTKFIDKNYQKAVVFSETTYYYLRKLRMYFNFFVFVPKTVVFTL